MIIPIKIETGESEGKDSTTVPIITFPPESADERRKVQETRFGDILIPTLSKYFSLRDSKRKDLRTLLAKEHPLTIGGFNKSDDKYELQLDVGKFKPDELSVKVTDHSVSILGKHEEQLDKHNYRKQEFLRRYSLPQEVRADDVECELSSDGHLLISAPKHQHKISISEVTVPIVLTNAIKRI